MEAADMINILLFIEPLMEVESSFGIYTIYLDLVL